MMSTILFILLNTLVNSQFFTIQNLTLSQKTQIVRDLSLNFAQRHFTNERFIRFRKNGFCKKQKCRIFAEVYSSVTSQEFIHLVGVDFINQTQQLLVYHVHEVSKFPFASNIIPIQLKDKDVKNVKYKDLEVTYKGVVWNYIEMVVSSEQECQHELVEIRKEVIKYHLFLDDKDYVSVIIQFDIVCGFGLRTQPLKYGMRRPIFHQIQINIDGDQVVIDRVQLNDGSYYIDYFYDEEPVETHHNQIYH